MNMMSLMDAVQANIRLSKYKANNIRFETDMVLFAFFATKRFFHAKRIGQEPNPRTETNLSGAPYKTIQTPTEYQTFCPVVRIGSHHPLTRKRVLLPPFGSQGGDLLAREVLGEPTKG